MKKWTSLILTAAFTFMSTLALADIEPGDFVFEYLPVSGVGATMELRLFYNGSGQYLDDSGQYDLLWRQPDDKTLLVIPNDITLQLPTTLKVLSNDQIEIDGNIFDRAEPQDHQDFEDEPEDYDTTSFNFQPGTFAIITDCSVLDGPIEFTIKSNRGEFHMGYEL